MRTNSFFRYLILTLVIFSGLLLPADAGKNWQWQFSLKGETAKDVMVMPSSLYVDSTRERYYVTDAGNNRLVSFDKNGKFLNSFTAKNSLNNPSDMVRTEDGLLWVIEKGKNTLTSIGLKSQEISQNTIEDKGRTVYPSRLELNEDTFYVLDKLSGNVLAINREMSVTKRFICPDCDNGFIDFKVQGKNLWALSLQEKAIYKFGEDGKYKSKVTLDDKVQFPYSFQMASGGLIFVLDRHEGKIVVFDNSGRFKYHFLGPGHARGKLYYPSELLIDHWGRLCIVDEGNGRVDVYSR